MRWRRCVSPDCGSLESAGFASPSCERCMPRREGVLRLFWTGVDQLLTRKYLVDLKSLTLHQLAKTRKRLVRLTRLLQRHCGGGGAVSAALVQRHDRQAQQQFLRDKLADADASAGGEHRLELVRHARGVRLGADE